MPSRGMDNVYPAPPFDSDGLVEKKSSPFPCKRESFSSTVISFSTISARASGERLASDQACFCSTPGPCASLTDARTLNIAANRMKTDRNICCTDHMPILPKPDKQERPGTGNASYLPERQSQAFGTSTKDRSRAEIEGHPNSRSVRSTSPLRISSARLTPGFPAAASPYAYPRPIS